MRLVRAAVHLHSAEWSFDGRWPLARVANTLRRLGYGLLLMTEHDRTLSEEAWRRCRFACQALSSQTLGVIPGIEYEDPEDRTHLLVWGPLPFLGRGLPAPEVLARVEALGGAAVVAHPYRHAVPRWLRPPAPPGLVGVEVWNRKSDGYAPNLAAYALCRRLALVPFVGLDLHGARQLFPLSMLIAVQPDLTEGSLVAALRAGRACARALGLPGHWFARGLPGRLARAAETARRRVARGLRAFRRPSLPAS